MKEFNLSEKVYNISMVTEDDDHNYNIIDEENVKEFIRLLKEEIDDNMYFYAGKQKAIGKNDVKQIIDKLAGDKLK